MKNMNKSVRPHFNYLFDLKINNSWTSLILKILRKSYIFTQCNEIYKKINLKSSFNAYTVCALNIGGYSYDVIH